jgi:hypothetical protein
MNQSIEADRNRGTRGLPRVTIAVAAVSAAALFCFVWLWSSRPSRSPGTVADLVHETKPAVGNGMKTRGVVPPIPIPEIERRILAALAKPFPAAHVGPEKLTLREAAGRIAKLLPVPVDFDTKSLDDASIDLEIEVELPQGNRTLGSALDAVLSSMPQPLVWIVRHEALTITSAEKAVEMRDTRVYDLTDLADPVVTPGGSNWCDAAPLAAALRKSIPELGDEDASLFDAVNINGRALIMASLSRTAHQDLADVLTKIRSAVESGSPLPSLAGPRRVAQKPRGKVPSQPVKATKGELAALEQLSKAAPAGLVPAVVSSSNAFAFDLYRASACFVSCRRQSFVLNRTMRANGSG